MLINCKSFAFLGRVFSATYFESVRNAARANMTALVYLRTYWQAEQGRFLAEFNEFVEKELCLEASV